jgi:RNA polymerase II subunit A small phosphatase-like protein
LDLDETLVHSSFKPFNCQSDILLKIEFEGKIHDIYVLKRPGVEDFLEKMARHYEIVIFTASLSRVKIYIYKHKYAEPLISKIDPKKCCSHRLFREHCTYINNQYIKDLSKLNRDLKDVIIIDVRYI